jgi:DNA polymerase epsilon subunit 1
LADEELIDLISENRVCQRHWTVWGPEVNVNYNGKRLAEFLGEQMTKDKVELQVHHLLQAEECPVTDRAVPVAIFSADEPVRRFFLRKWLQRRSRRYGSKKYS